MTICDMNGVGRAMKDSLPCNCKNLDCPYNGTKCIDNPEEAGVIQLPCMREIPSVELCSTCCMLGDLYGICAFYREGV
jgi:hypothetical protein